MINYHFRPKLFTGPESEELWQDLNRAHSTTEVREVLRLVMYRLKALEDEVVNLKNEMQEKQDNEKQ